MMLTIFVGVPEDDNKVEVPGSMTVAELLEQENIQIRGSITLNGRTLAGSEMQSTLSDLGVTNNDAIHVVRKLDSAQH